MAERNVTSDREDIDRVWKLIEKIDICMFASRDGEKIRARPMSSIPRQAENTVYFLTDVKGHKDDEVASDESVSLLYAKPGDGKFLAVTGKARISNDRGLIQSLWNTGAEAWWSGPDDPSVRVNFGTPVEKSMIQTEPSLAMVIALSTSNMIDGISLLFRNGVLYVARTLPVPDGSSIVTLPALESAAMRPSLRSFSNASRAISRRIGL